MINRHHSIESKQIMSDKAKNRIQNDIDNNIITSWHLPSVIEKRSKEFLIKKLKEKLKKYDITLLNVDDYYIKNNDIIKWKCNKCEEESQYHFVHFNCNNCHPKPRSRGQQEIENYIKEIYKGQIFSNTRKPLDNKLELDIYLPEYNLAIEYDGLYYHSEINGNTDKFYHIDKTNKCEEKGIRLIHIFEDEWIYKQQIVKNRIKHILNLDNDIRIYARKCDIRITKSSDKKTFLNEIHIQGNDNSKINIGLFYNNELVSLMTFGKLRLALGNKIHKENEYELSRFASKYNIIGGASKLLTYFIRNYNPIKIISYEDKRWSNGDLYNKLGFTQSKSTSLNYWYILNNKRYHRFNFTKHIIINKLNSNPNLTEWENMKILKYDRIWDCGSLKFIWNK